MKRKAFITSILTLGLGFSLFTGLSTKKDVAPTRASDYWSFLFTLDLSTSDTDIPYREDFNPSTLEVECWYEDSGNDLSFPMHHTGTGYVYMVIAQFENSFLFDGFRFSFEGLDGKIYSSPYGVDVINYESENRCIKATHTGEYLYNQWVLEADLSYSPIIKINNEINYLQYDDDYNQFVLYDMHLTKDTYINFYVYDESEEYMNMVDNESLDAYFSEHGSNYAKVKESGEFDIFLNNDFSNSGVIHFISKSQSIEGSIYLFNVSENDNVYVYNTSGDELYGSFPGTKLGEISDASQVLQTIKYNEEECEIWKIDLEIGYLANEYIILTKDAEDEDREDYDSSILIDKAAYEYSLYGGKRNVSLGNALDFACLAEPIRLGALTDSICSITEEGATAIINAYNALNEDDRLEVANLTIYTYSKSGQGKEDVSYKDVVETLGAKYNIVVVGSSLFNFQSPIFTNNIAIIIISITGLSTLFVVLLLVFKKRKNN